MPGKQSDNGSRVSRRNFVKAAGASGAAVSMAGCIYGGGGDSDAVVWGFDPNAADAIGEDVKQLYSDNGVDADIELRPGDSDTGARRDNYQRLLEAGEAEPDIFMMDSGWVNVFIQQGLISNLSEELESSELQTVQDDYFEGFTATARDPDSGDLFGMPMYPDFPVMQYNKEYARQAGYGESDFETWATEPMTWQEWSQLTAEIQEAAGVKHGFTTQWDIYVGTSCCTFNEVMSSWGGAYFGGRENLFGPVGDRPVTVNGQETIDSLRMMRTFVDEDYDDALDGYASGIMPSNVTQWTEESSRSPMADGDAVMHRNWPYAIGSNAADDALGQENYGTMPIPYAVTEDEAAQPGTGGTTSALGGWHIVLNPNSERKEEAMEVIRTTMKDDVYLGLFELWGWLPPKPELFESERAAETGVVGNYLDTIRVAGENAMARPSTTVWPTQATMIAEQANAAVAGDKSPEQAMNDLQSSLENTEQQ